MPKKPTSAWAHIKLDRITAARQVRTSFSEAKLAELAASLKDGGIIQAIVVRPVGESFEVVVGERRYRAAVMAGLDTIPCAVRDCSDAEALKAQLAENLHREDLSDLDLAHGLKALLDATGASQSEVASWFGKSQSWLANLLRLLDAPEPIKARVADGSLSAGAAVSLLPVADDPEKLARVTAKLGKGKATVARVRQAVREETEGETPPSMVKQIADSANAAAATALATLEAGVAEANAAMDDAVSRVAAKCAPAPKVDKPIDRDMEDYWALVNLVLAARKKVLACQEFVDLRAFRARALAYATKPPKRTCGGCPVIADLFYLANQPLPPTSDPSEGGVYAVDDDGRPVDPVDAAKDADAAREVAEQVEDETAKRPHICPETGDIFTPAACEVCNDRNHRDYGCCECVKDGTAPFTCPNCVAYEGCAIARGGDAR